MYLPLAPIPPGAQGQGGHPFILPPPHQEPGEGVCPPSLPPPHQGPGKRWDLNLPTYQLSLDRVRLMINDMGSM